MKIYLVIALGELALLVDERHEVERPHCDEVERLLVVDELDVLPVDRLVVVLLLLHLEDVLHEELLQVLVGEVDAKLLEAVCVEVLEAKDVKHSYCTFVIEFDVRLVYCSIYLLHNEDKQTAVNAFGKGVTNVL